MERPWGEWTPEEIKAQRFRGSLFGFSRREVRDFLRVLANHKGQLNDKIEELEGEIAAFRAREAQIQKEHQRAQEQAKALLQETEQKASDIRKRTEEWLEEVIAKVEQTQRQKQSFLTAFKSALDSHYELIEHEESDETSLADGLSDILRGAAVPKLEEPLASSPA